MQPCVRMFTRTRGDPATPGSPVGRLLPCHSERERSQSLHTLTKMVSTPVSEDQILSHMAAPGQERAARDVDELSDVPPFAQNIIPNISPDHRSLPAQASRSTRHTASNPTNLPGPRASSTTTLTPTPTSTTPSEPQQVLAQTRQTEHNLSNATIRSRPSNSDGPSSDQSSTTLTSLSQPNDQPSTTTRSGRPDLTTHQDDPARSFINTADNAASSLIHTTPNGSPSAYEPPHRRSSNNEIISFVLDSGSTYHTHYDRAHLRNLRSCSQVFTGSNGQPIHCDTIGDLPCIVPTNNGPMTATISNVFFVPHHQYSLLSVHQLEQKGGKM